MLQQSSFQPCTERRLRRIYFYGQVEELTQVCPQMSPREKPPRHPVTGPDKRAKDAKEGPSELVPEAKQSLTQRDFGVVTAKNSIKEIKIANPVKEGLWSKPQ